MIRLWHGDAGLLLDDLEVDPAQTVCITDPVWPNAVTSLMGATDPAAVFAPVMRAISRLTRRLIVILGIDSDPRFLVHVPPELVFVRVTYLRLARPSYKGPVLNGGDIAYVFGEWPMAYPGQKVFPGEIVATQSRSREPWKTAHPCPRRLEHMVGLIRGYTREEDLVVDPFAGAGRTLIAAAQNRRRSLGIEIDPRWCAELLTTLPDASAQQQLPVDP